MSSSVEPEAGAPEAALVALSLDHAYQAFESLLVRVERALGLPERGGAGWHGELLADAALELADLRPPIVTAAAQLHWAALLRFRHFLRHAYAVRLDAELLRRNREHLREAVEVSQPTIEALSAALA